MLETSGHVDRWRDDLALLRSCGIHRLRYPVRWHRIEARAGEYDWRSTDEVLHHLRDEGFEPIVDLLHHTSYPRWIDDGFADARFGPAYVRFCEAFALRHGWVREYTLFNEPFATLFLAGHEGVWPPYRTGLRGLVPLYRNTMPALAEASRRLREILPDARHVWVDTCERHTAEDEAAEGYAAMANDRRFFALDLLLGRAGDRDRPFVADVVAAGGADVLETEPATVDVLGLDYYAHSEWRFRTARPCPGAATRDTATGLLDRDPDSRPIRGVAPPPAPSGFAALAIEYGARYDVPLLLTETNVRGTPSDRATWLRHMLEECGRARDAGARLEGWCWFPFVDSLDWNSLLARADRCIDPVGVFWLDEHLERHESSMSLAYRSAAAGTPATKFPAYDLTAGVAESIGGLLPRMSHFDWRPAPVEERILARRGPIRARSRPKAPA